jgi:uncharacterized protein
VEISGLFVYPVKGLRGCSTPAAEVDGLGLVGDRRFMVIDPSGKFLSQRTLPRMALIATALDATTLTLSVAGHGQVVVSRTPEPQVPLRSVSVWKSEGLLAEDCGDAAATWLSAALQAPCRLVRIGPKFLRPILKAVAGPGDRVHFGDAYPFLIISESTLADLNDRLVAQGETAVPMNRFRPNLVVRGCPAFAEDDWTRFRIGDVTFHAAGPCARCMVPTIDQDSAEGGREPMRTLASYRRDARDPGNVNFGQNLIHETKRGTLRVGDAVEMLA